MADDNELDLELEGDKPATHPIDKRINTALSQRDQAQRERDEAIKAQQERDAKIAEQNKELEFFKGFSKVSGKYAGSGDYQDAIREKVMAGYDVEDATVAVLIKEGKYTAPAAPMTPMESPAGGSAVNTPSVGADKPISEMTQAERISALKQAEAEGQEISRIFQPRNLG